MRRDLKFLRTHEMSADKLLRVGHSVKTFDGSTYINSLDGKFIEINSLKRMSIQQILPTIRTVFNTRLEIVGKRKQLGQPLFSGHLVPKRLPVH